MRKYIIFSSVATIALAAMTALSLSSCNKEDVTAQASEPQEIVLNVSDGIDLDVETKATTEVTTIPSSLYFGATTGTAGSSDAVKWAAATGSVSSNKISTGKYQSATPTAYNWYVSNKTFTVAATGPTIAADNGTDIISGVAKANSTASPSVTLNHIFSRVKLGTTTSPNGYSVSGVSVTIKSTSSTDITGTAGTYNMATDKWTAASTRLTTAQSLTSSSDLYLIPGTYTLTATYTLSKTGFSKTYTSKTTTVTIAQGKINTINCSFSNNEAQAITLVVSLTAWGAETQTATFS